MSYELISQTNPKARKDHDCIWCREKILKGEVYIYELSKYDGLQSHHWHPECQEAACKEFKESGEEEFMAHGYERGATNEA